MEHHPAEIEEGCWVRVRDAEYLQRVPPRAYPISVHQVAYAGERLQVSGTMDRFGELVFGLYGAPGAWLEQDVVVEPGGPKPIDYEYSGAMAKKHIAASKQT